MHSIFEARVLTTSLSLLISDKLETSRFLIIDEISLINNASSSLIFAIENLDELMSSSAIGIETVRGAWSEESCQSGWIEWLLSSDKPLHRNIKLITEFDSPTVSEYLVGTWLVRIDKSKLKESAMIIRSSLIEE